MYPEESLLRWNEALYNAITTVEEIKECVDPTEFERAFKEVLENKSVNTTTFWSEESLKSIPLEQREFLEGQINEYRDLKGLILKIVERGPEDVRRALMDFRPEKVFGTIAFQDKYLGEFMGGYTRLATNCLAYELIKIFEDREKSEAEKLNDKGHELNQEGKYEEALHFLEKALTLSPCYCLALINKGIALKNLGQLDEAIRCYNTVIESINPKYKKAWHNKAVAL